MIVWRKGRALASAIGDTLFYPGGSTGCIKVIRDPRHRAVALDF